MGVEDRGQRAAGDSRDEAAVPPRAERGFRIAYASCVDAVAGVVPIRRFQGRTRSVHGEAGAEFQRAVRESGQELLRVDAATPRTEPGYPCTRADREQAAFACLFARGKVERSRESKLEISRRCGGRVA